MVAMQIQAMQIFVALLTIGYVTAEHPQGMGVFDMLDATDCSADIAFVLDASGSVGSLNWQKMLNFVKAFASSVQISPDENQFGVISFGNDASLHIKLNNAMTHRAFNQSVDSIDYKDENTNTASGLRLLRTQMFTTDNGDRADYPNIAVVLTDGKPTYEREFTVYEADAVKDTGAYIFAIGIGQEGIDVAELSEIASKPNETFVYKVLGFDALTSILETIVKDVCKIKIKETPGPSDCQQKDIAFVLDSSGSIGIDDWNKMKQFVKDFISKLSVGGETDNQIGIVSYSTESFLQNYLDEKQTRLDLHRLVDKIPWIEQRTNTSGALRLTRNVIFRPDRGDRSDYPNVVIAVTDGHSNTDEHLTAVEGKQLRDRGIRTFTVGVGLQADMLELYDMSAKPHRFHTFLMKDFNGLVSDGEMSIYDAVCIKNNDYPQEIPDISNAIDNARADIVIVMDASSNMGQSEYPILKQRIKEAIVPFRNARSRMAFVTLGSGSQVNNFRTYTQQAELINAVNSMGYQGGFTNWNRLVTNLLTLSSQRRSGYPMPIILVTASMLNDVSVSSSFLQIRKQTNSPVIVVTTRSSVNATQIGKAIASDPSHVITGTDMSKMFQYAMSWACLSGAQTVFSCTFENDQNDQQTCGIIQSTQDNFDWSISTGRTPSRHTGPESAYSSPYYMYIEASGKRTGDVAEFLLPTNNYNGETYCLSFRYHMLGWHIGSLLVFKRDTFGKERILWMKYGPQVDNMIDSYFDGWQEGSITTVLYFGDKLGFRAIRGDEFSGDTALDNIKLQKGYCYFDFMTD